jgi:hypothetical protein
MKGMFEFRNWIEITPPVEQPAGSCVITIGDKSSSQLKQELHSGA